jgi:23S rRNA (uridine2552-2'-O)-methyltransferase
LDLGAAPGSWIQLAQQIVGPSGLVVGVDLKEFEHTFSKQVVTLQRDIMELGFEEELIREYAPFNVILSDMAPSTSGIKVADSARSALLVERAMELARLTLKGNGHLLVKIFQGSEFHQLLVQFKKEFGLVKVVKPEASRKESKEIYILAMRFKKP